MSRIHPESPTRTLVIGRQPPSSSFDKSQTRMTKRKRKATAKKIKMMTTMTMTVIRSERALASVGEG
jgi:hypothetical protein